MDLAEIPSLDLNGSMYPRSLSPTSSSVAATDGESGPPSRRTSFSSNGRTSSGTGPGSRSSSRSTSFNLPSDAREAIRRYGRQPGDEGEVEVDEEMDEESTYKSRMPCDTIFMLTTCDPAAAKHAAFVRARGRHYSNEAEAMKVRANASQFLKRILTFVSLFSSERRSSWKKTTRRA